MSTSLTATLKVKLAWLFQNVLDLNTAEDSYAWNQSEALANGTSENMANDMFHDRRYLTTGSPTDDLDLAGGLTNSFGETLTFTAIKQIVIYNLGVPDASHATWTPTAGEDLDIGGAASNPFTAPFDGGATSKVTVPSGGMLVMTAPLDGWTVTAGSADTLRVALDGGGANDVDYEIVIIGVD